jgi:hypothetical protein
MFAYVCMFVSTDPSVFSYLPFSLLRRKQRKRQEELPVHDSIMPNTGPTAQTRPFQKGHAATLKRHPLPLSHACFLYHVRTMDNLTPPSTSHVQPKLSQLSQQNKSSLLLAFPHPHHFGGTAFHI